MGKMGGMGERGRLNYLAEGAQVRGERLGERAKGKTSDVGQRSLIGGEEKGDEATVESEFIDGSLDPSVLLLPTPSLLLRGPSASNASDNVSGSVSDNASDNVSGSASEDRHFASFGFPVTSSLADVMVASDKDTASLVYFAAVERGDVRQVLSLLASGLVNVDAKDRRRRGPTQGTTDQAGGDGGAGGEEGVGEGTVCWLGFLESSHRRESQAEGTPRRAGVRKGAMGGGDSPRADEAGEGNLLHVAVGHVRYALIHDLLRFCRGDLWPSLEGPGLDTKDASNTVANTVRAEARSFRMVGL